MVYFRLLIIQMPTIAAIAMITADAIIATSLVIIGVSVGSGSIGPAG